MRNFQLQRFALSAALILHPALCKVEAWQDPQQSSIVPFTFSFHMPPVDLREITQGVSNGVINLLLAKTGCKEPDPAKILAHLIHRLATVTAAEHWAQ